jgi:hypothetical protein
MMAEEKAAGSTRGKARNERKKAAKAEAETQADINRAGGLLKQKYQAILAHQNEIHTLRGSMLGIIEAFDLTAMDANNLLGTQYFAELDEDEKTIPTNAEPVATPEQIKELQALADKAASEEQKEKQSEAK